MKRNNSNFKKAINRLLAAKADSRRGARALASSFTGRLFSSVVNSCKVKVGQSFTSPAASSSANITHVIIKVVMACGTRNGTVRVAVVMCGALLFKTTHTCKATTLHGCNLKQLAKGMDSWKTNGGGRVYD